MLAANYRNAIPAYEYKGITPDTADYKLLLPLYCPALPAERYLLPLASYASRTKILRLQLRMTVSGGKSRNAAAIGGYIILIDAHGVDTTTLGPKGPVKL